MLGIDWVWQVFRTNQFFFTWNRCNKFSQLKFKVNYCTSIHEENLLRIGEVHWDSPEMSSSLNVLHHWITGKFQDGIFIRVFVGLHQMVWSIQFLHSHMVPSDVIEHIFSIPWGVLILKTSFRKRKWIYLYLYQNVKCLWLNDAFQHWNYKE